MKITFWGVRGSIAAPGPDTVIYGGNTTTVEICQESNKTIIIDAGTGIRSLGDSLLINKKYENLHLLLSHVHWDHILGFPFFAPVFLANVHLKLGGSKRGMDGLRRILSSNFIDGSWPVRFEDLKAKIEPQLSLPEKSLVIDSIVVTAHPIQHPQGGMGFKFVENGKSFIFLTDNELLHDGWNGTSFKDFVKFCKSADILVHDCQYLPEEMETRKGWGHSDIDSVARLARDSQVRKLILFHHDPWRTDAAIDSMVERCSNLPGMDSIAVSAAKEGTMLII